MSEIFDQLIEQYQTIQQQLKDPHFALKLVGISYFEDADDPILHIEFAKKELKKIALSVLLATKGILFFFDQKDIERIIELKVKMSSQNLMVTDHFEENQITRVVFKNKAGQRFSETIRSLNHQKIWIEQFSVKDAYLLGYLLGCELSKL